MKEQSYTSLMLRKIPIDIMEHLKSRAEENNRSVQGEIMTILKTTITQSAGSVMRTIYQRNLALGRTNPDQAASIVREIRDER